MSLEDKILACHGHLTYRSIAKTLNVSQDHVAKVMHRNKKPYVAKSYSIRQLAEK